MKVCLPAAFRGIRCAGLLVCATGAFGALLPLGHAAAEERPSVANTPEEDGNPQDSAPGTQAADPGQPSAQGKRPNSGDSDRPRGTAERQEESEEEQEEEQEEDQEEDATTPAGAGSVEIFVPSEDISEDVSVPFPVDI